MQSGRRFGSAVSGFLRNVVLPVASTVGKSLVRKGMKTASGVLSGVAEGKGLKRAFMEELQAPSVVTSRPRKHRKVVHATHKKTKNEPRNVRIRTYLINRMRCPER